MGRSILAFLPEVLKIEVVRIDIMTKETALVIPIERIQQCIYLIRNQKVMLDKDLAYLYGVRPIALRQQVKRNTDRFPLDFMFQLTDKEVDILLSQNVIPSRKL